MKSKRKQDNECNMCDGTAIRRKKLQWPKKEATESSLI